MLLEVDELNGYKGADTGGLMRPGQGVYVEGRTVPGETDSRGQKHSRVETRGYTRQEAFVVLHTKMSSVNAKLKWL